MKRSSYSPVVFKHGCSSETHLEFEEKSHTSAFVFFKKDKALLRPKKKRI